jgi:CheY-like chemotaxis protein
MLPHNWQIMTVAPAQILLVDDEEGFRYAAAKTLRDSGFDVIAVPDYRGALAALEGSEPLDLLITDVVMPKPVNGLPWRAWRACGGTI